MNLVNLASNPVSVPTYAVNPTPGKPMNKLSTPSVAVTDSPSLETPLLYCNSVSSTPVPLALACTPGQMSGISVLNTTESDSSHLKPPNATTFNPPLLR